MVNVSNQLEKLKSNAAVLKAVQSDKLILVGAFYEISSGIVDFTASLPREALWGMIFPGICSSSFEIYFLLTCGARDAEGDVE